jgi:hypothetical protein
MKRAVIALLLLSAVLGAQSPPVITYTVVNVLWWQTGVAVTPPVLIFRNGLFMSPGVDYVVLPRNLIRFIAGPVAGDLISIVTLPSSTPSLPAPTNSVEN